ncbi:MAG: hypothetical protein AB7N65_15660 [Vicinamibacterales bacterium]
MGDPNAAVHRINDLSLKVTSPIGTVYWGNVGLLSGNWSQPGGIENHVDTVENVFIQTPVAGTWRIDVIATEVNQDAHLETLEKDADYALVISGGTVTGSGNLATPGDWDKDGTRTASDLWRYLDDFSEARRMSIRTA